MGFALALNPSYACFTRSIHVGRTAAFGAEGSFDAEPPMVGSPPFSATQPSRRESLFLPQSGHSHGQT